ncbi:MAG: PilZ domain-containing protein [Candidatus Omnitrophota bacterium]
MAKSLEKRKYRRLPREIYVISKLYLGGSEKEKLFLTKDISSGGVMFYSKQKLPADAKMHMKIHLPTMSKPIDVTARVVRSSEIERGPLYAIGLEFIKIGTKDKKEIARFMASCLLTKEDVKALLGK